MVNPETHIHTHPLPPKPWYRSRMLLFGSIPLMFLIWTWWDSNHHEWSMELDMDTNVAKEYTLSYSWNVMTIEYEWYSSDSVSRDFDVDFDYDPVKGVVKRKPFKIFSEEPDPDIGGFWFAAPIWAVILVYYYFFLLVFAWWMSRKNKAAKAG